MGITYGVKIQAIELLQLIQLQQYSKLILSTVLQLLEACRTGPIDLNRAIARARASQGILS